MGFVKIDTWISRSGYMVASKFLNGNVLSCYMDLSKLFYVSLAFCQTKTSLESFVALSMLFLFFDHTNFFSPYCCPPDVCKVGKVGLFVLRLN